MTETRPNVVDPGRIIAHRGASFVAPENTLTAFRAADAQGVFWIEFDVSLLGDGTPIIHHDDTLDRCTNGTGPLSAINGPQLASLDAGDGAPPPLLGDGLDLLEELRFFANLELKPHGLAPGVTAAAAARALRSRPWTQKRIIVSSFSIPELHEMRALMPDVAIAALYVQPADDWIETTRALNAAAIHVQFTHLSQHLLTNVQREGIDCRVYTANEPSIMAPFRSLGLTGVITDHPPDYLDDTDWRRWAGT